MDLNPKDSAKHHTYAPAKTNTLEGWPQVKGVDMDALISGKKTIKALLDAYSTTGQQATNLAGASETIRQMRKDNATIFLSFTSNMVTGGTREVIRWLVQNKHVNALVCSAGAIEEDLIKCLRPFVIGSFDAAGKMLYNEGVNRAGNIFVPNDRYVKFEDFIDPILDELHAKQKKSGKAIDTSELCAELGKRIEKAAGKGGAKDSILWWAQKNNIPVFCPAITDGSFGDLVFFQKQRNKDFQIDITGDMQKLVKLVLNSEKTGVICLGGGTSKHYLLNSQLFRDGADFAVFVNTASDFDGSDSGARPDEAVSWGKLKPNSVTIKVTCDASIAFPLIMAGGFC